MARLTDDSMFTLHLLAAVAALSLAAACGSDVTEAGAGASTTGGGGSGATGATGGGGTGGTTTGGGGAGAGGAGAGGGGTAGSGGGSAVQCNPTGVVCADAPPFCPPGQVVSIDGTCWGPCVPILSCATEPNCANCEGAFCAEYVAWTIEYRCVLPTLQCSALMCGCLAPYFCPEPFDACSEPGSSVDHVVTCGCPTC